MREDLLTQEDLLTSPRRASIEMSEDPLKMIHSCEPDLLQIPQPQDPHMRLPNALQDCGFDSGAQKRLIRSLHAPASGPQRFQTPEHRFIQAPPAFN